MRPIIDVGRSYYLVGGEIIKIVKFDERRGFIDNRGNAHNGYGGQDIVRELTPDEYTIRRLEDDWEAAN